MRVLLNPVVLLLVWALAPSIVDGGTTSKTRGSRTHTNNWAVLVGTSRFWFNYRHVANTLSLYHALKSNGIPDSNIILMLADDMPCNARNVRPARVFAEKADDDVYGTNVEVDYRGFDVNVENFLRVLTGRHTADTPPSKRLLTDANSNVFVYLSGHGGDEFLKFQDSEEIAAHDFADAVEQMHIQGRFNELLFMTDTCQAHTLNNQFYSPNVIAVGSSLKNQNSFAHHVDAGIGVAIIDRFSYLTGVFLGEHKRDTSLELSRLFDLYRTQSNFMMAQVGVRHTQLKRPLSEFTVMDFFGSVQCTQPLHSVRTITAPPHDVVSFNKGADAVLASSLVKVVYKPQAALGSWQGVAMKSEFLLGIAAISTAVVILLVQHVSMGKRVDFA